MFNAEEIQKILFGRVGWRNDNSPVELCCQNAKSLSRRYFQDVYRAVTLTNIYDSMEVANADKDRFNDFLRNLQSSAILNSVSAIFNEDSLIEQVLLFNGDSKKRGAVYDLSGKRGYRIDVAKDPSYCAVIRTVSLNFAESGDIRFYVVHSNGQKLFESSVNVEAGREAVVDVDLPLYYACDLYRGGFFYLYYESDLKPTEYDSPGFNKTYLFRAEPFQGDLSDPNFTNNTYGINMDVCTYRDFTEVIRRSDHLFDTVIGLQMAANVIELIINSTRSNATERAAKYNTKELYNDLNIAYSSPEFPYSTGIKNQISREIKRLKENLLPKAKGGTQTPCFTGKNYL